jgi:predicted aminopeptidase
VRRAALAVTATAGVLAATVLLLSAEARYLVRAGWEEAGILWRRRPIVELVADPTTHPATRAQLLLVLAARTFGAESLGLAAGETYTTFSRVDRDTLVLVLSAARRDTLASYTWSYPIVGRVPYKGFFDFARAQREARRLARAGLDTYLRPSAAFSTLGWFNDPLLSTVLGEDSVELAATVLHEITHNTLFVRGHVDFNESLAQCVGYLGAAAFFAARGESALAERARARWRDELRLGRFYARLSDRLDAIYAADAFPAAKVVAVADAYHLATDELAGALGAQLETINGPRLAARPLNNAVLLAARVYRSRLDRFDAAVAARGGDVRRVVAELVAAAVGSADPWGALERMPGSAVGAPAPWRGAVGP